MGNQRSKLPGAAAHATSGAASTEHAAAGAAQEPHTATLESSHAAAPAPAPALPTVPMPMPARRATLDDFIMMKTVGKGSFGKVVMVRKKDDGKVYAMKILKKQMVLARKQYEHTLSERRILENIDHPFIVSLRFAFQTEHKLYMVVSTGVVHLEFQSGSDKPFLCLSLNRASFCCFFNAKT
jgi:serum/glucocorticoid-regulated kinase 2